MNDKKYRSVTKFVQEENITAPVYFVHWFKKEKKTKKFPMFSKCTVQ